MELDKDLAEAIELMQHVHSTIWVHFDPDLRYGDKKQPPDIRKRLREIRQFCRKHGVITEGWKR